MDLPNHSDCCLPNTKTPSFPDSSLGTFVYLPVCLFYLLRVRDEEPNNDNEPDLAPYIHAVKGLSICKSPPFHIKGKNGMSDGTMPSFSCRTLHYQCRQLCDPGVMLGHSLETKSMSPLKLKCIITSSSRYTHTLVELLH